ncbi:MAG: hypothetical protein ABSA52_23780 [Candidatus Binatia bacterium]
MTRRPQSAERSPAAENLSQKQLGHRHQWLKDLLDNRPQPPPPLTGRHQQIPEDRHPMANAKGNKATTHPARLVLELTPREWKRLCQDPAAQAAA